MDKKVQNSADKTAHLDQTTDWEQSVSLVISELGVSSFQKRNREQGLVPAIRPEAQLCNFKGFLATTVCKVLDKGDCQL